MVVMLFNVRWLWFQALEISKRFDYLCAMSAIADKMNKTPWLYIVTCLLGLAFIAIKFTDHELPQGGAVVILEVILLGFAVFGAVHHAEILATKTGEPLGSIVLALAVTIIEVALIISQMAAGKPGAEYIGRDTVFATIMIVLNGVVGLGLLIGAARHYEQKFNLDGATSALSVLGTLAASALILPNFTVAAAGPFYSNSQLAFVAVVSITLYAIFVFVQTVRHNQDFSSENQLTTIAAKPSFRTVFISGVFLPLTLLIVVLMAKLLSPSVASSIQAAGLPASFLGVIIASLVLLPEGFAALRAARNNDLQTSLNHALGSAIATIGLTIPTLAAYSLWHGQNLALGISSTSTALLVLTLFIGSVTLATGRTTILQGAVHLVIFGIYIFLSATP